MASVSKFDHIVSIIGSMKADMAVQGAIVFFALFFWWPPVASWLFSPIRAVTTTTRAWRYLFKGQDIIQEGFEKVCKCSCVILSEMKFGI